MGDEELVARLAGLSGLDPPSVQDQLVPYLRSLPRSEQGDHLRSMLGPSAPVEEVLSLLSPSEEKKFPLLPSADALLAEAYGRSAPAPDKPKKGKGKKTQPPGLAHTRKGHLPAPRTVRSVAPTTGQVYSKEHSLDAIGAQYGSRKKPASASASASASATPSGISTPASRVRSPAPPSPAPSPAAASGSGPKPASAPAPSSRPHADSQPVPAPTPEPEPEPEGADGLLALPRVDRPGNPTPELIGVEDALAQLRVPHPAVPKAGVACFCAGHVHGPAAWVPMCTQCQLVLCAGLVPAPLAPGARCPSCGTFTLLDTDGGGARKGLYAQVLARYEQLCTQLVREEKEEERRREVQRQLQRERERAQAQLIAQQRGHDLPLDELFPDLPPLARRNKASASEAVGEKTHRVLTLNSKTHTMTERRVKKVRKPVSAPAPAAARPSAPQASDSSSDEEEEEEEEEERILIPDPYDLGQANPLARSAAGTAHRTPRTAGRKFAPPFADGGADVLYSPAQRGGWSVPPWSAWVQAGVPVEQEATASEDESLDGDLPSEVLGVRPDEGTAKGKGKDVVPPVVEPQFAMPSGSSQPPKPKKGRAEKDRGAERERGSKSDAKGKGRGKGKAKA